MTITRHGCVTGQGSRVRGSQVTGQVRYPHHGSLRPPDARVSIDHRLIDIIDDGKFV